MDHPYTGGNWTMIPNMPTHSNSPAHSNSDQFYLQQQQQQQQFNPQQQFQQQQYQQQQQQQQQRFIQQQQQRQRQRQPSHQHQSLASHFHLRNLVENLADVIENGTRDQHSDALVNELSNYFEKCQQLLNTISSQINTKAMTVEGEKQKLEDSEQLLIQQRDLINGYRYSVEELIKSEP